MAKPRYPYNPQSKMNGPYALTRDSVSRVVPSGKIGTYLLASYGKTMFGTDAVFIEYVGRSLDLRDRLLEHVPERYLLLYFKELATESSAYLSECEDYHRYGGTSCLDNEVHPAKPSIVSPRCPVCSQ